MKIAVVGSRGLQVDIAGFIPEGATEIISGGARGVDALAEAYARKAGLPLRVFLPDTRLLGKMAYFVRNDQIVDAADVVVAIWDGKSRGTRYTIERARKMNKPVEIHLIPNS